VEESKCGQRGWHWSGKIVGGGGQWKSEGKEEPVQIYNKLISLLLRKQHNKTSVMASKYFTRRERARSTNLILLAPMPWIKEEIQISLIFAGRRTI
jgi:hypothetical protein